MYFTHHNDMHRPCAADAATHIDATAHTYNMSLCVGQPVEWPADDPYLMAGYKVLTLAEANRRPSLRVRAGDDSDEEDLEASVVDPTIL